MKGWEETIHERCLWIAPVGLIKQAQDNKEKSRRSCSQESNPQAAILHRATNPGNSKEPEDPAAQDQGPANVSHTQHPKKAVKNQVGYRGDQTKRNNQTTSKVKRRNHFFNKEQGSVAGSAEISHGLDCRRKSAEWAAGGLPKTPRPENTVDEQEDNRGASRCEVCDLGRASESQKGHSLAGWDEQTYVSIKIARV